MNLTTSISGLVRCVHLGATLVLCAAGYSGFAADETAPDPIIELPRFIVTDSRELPPPEEWRYATLPGLEILSSASDRATQRLISDFQMFREALDIMWPMPAKLTTPVLLVVCGRGRQFESFVPPESDAGSGMASISLYLRGSSRAAIVIDLATTVINLNSFDADIGSTVMIPNEIGGFDLRDESTGVDPTRFSVEHNKQLYREYVRYLLGRSNPRLPAWFEEGMAQIVMQMEFTPKWIEFGKLDDPNAVSAEAAFSAAMNAMDAAAGIDAMPMAGGPVEDRDFNAALARRSLIPMAELLAVPHGSPVARNPLGNNVWSKQCYAFVHMCLYGERGRFQKPFTEFLLRCTQEPATEQLFRECFKMSFKDMGLQLRGYIQYTNYRSMIVRAKDGSRFLNAPRIEFRDATPSEVGRIKGHAKLLAGRMDGARGELIAPYVRGERDPQLLAALGLIEHAAGKHDRARRFLTSAVAAKCTDPQAYYELARYLYADAVAAPAGGEGRFSPEQVSGIANLLLASRTLPPPNASTYELLADTLDRGSVRPGKEDVGALVQGVYIFPRRMRLVYQTAALAADAGLAEAAHSLVEHGLKNAPDAVTRTNFERLRAALPPVPVQPAAKSP